MKTGLIATLLAFVAARTDAQIDPTATRAQNAATVISVVVIGVVALVGLLIFGQIYDAMPLDSDVFVEEEDGALHGVPDAILAGFGDAMEFVPIILLVLLASVVIAVVQRMRM